VRYRNLDGTTPDKGFLDLVKWQATRKRVKKPFVTPLVANDGSALDDPSPHVTWVGHASFTFRLGKKLVAADPIWAERLGHIKRNAPPGLPEPRAEIVTVSHAHYDHLDLPTLKRFAEDTLFIVPKDNGDILKGMRVIELDWWQSHREGDLEITLVPAQHWSMRAPWDRNKRLWGGFVYQSHEGTAYHAGDTAFSERVFAEIGRRFPIDWAMLPIGAYEPEWFMSPQHQGPEEAGRAWEILGAKNLLAMHWGTFQLTDEWLGDPPARIAKWFEDQRHDPSRLWLMKVGETRALTR
jgi:L-ascorbate metabolism protein UlaG (beta-lactamase superfamily)